MYEWVDENFAKYDTDKTGALTLEEFVKLYRVCAAPRPDRCCRGLTKAAPDAAGLSHEGPRGRDATVRGHGE